MTAIFAFSAKAALKTLSLAVLLCLALGAGAAHANAKLLGSDAEVNQFWALKDLQWAPGLDARQQDFVVKSLAADNFLIVAEAIKAILVHHVAAARGPLQNVANRENPAVNDFAKAAARLLQGPAEKRRAALRDYWQRMPKEPRDPAICDLDDSEADMVFATLVVMEAQALRADAKAERFLEGANPYQAALFKYSLLPQGEALEEVFAAMLQTKGQTAKDGYPLMSVLNIFGDAARAKIIAALLSDEALMEATPAGRFLLVDALWRHVPGLSREEARQLSARFLDPKVRAEFFSEPQELASTASLISEKLQLKAAGKETIGVTKDAKAGTAARPRAEGKTAKPLPGSAVPLAQALACPHVFSGTITKGSFGGPDAPGQMTFFGTIAIAETLKGNAKGEMEFYVDVRTLTLPVEYAEEEEPRVGASYVFFARGDAKVVKMMSAAPETLECLKALVKLSAQAKGD